MKIDSQKIIKMAAIIAGSILLGMIGGSSLQLQVKTDEKIKTITIEQGSIEFSETAIPLIEEIDGGKIDVTGFSSKGEIYPVTTPQDFMNATENKCVIEGNSWGAQCVSLAQAFWKSYANRSISDCGTGAARGIWQCRNENAGTDFEIVEGFQNLQAGDWAVFDSGEHGHIGMVYAEPEGNYIPLYGENQGGKSCETGGSEPNKILISNKTLLGVFRPKIYINKEAPVAPDGGTIK